MNYLRNKVILQHIARRITRNQNAMILLVGDTGSGKSYAALRLLGKLRETLKELYGLEPLFNINFVEFKSKQFLKLVKGDHPKGTGILFDEVGIAINARDWQSKFNKMISYVLQTFRFKNYIVVFTVPDMSYIDAQARKLFHYYFEAKGIDYDKQISKFNVRRVQINRQSGQAYKKIIRYHDNQNDVLGRAGMIKLKLPHKKLIDAYEKKRALYIDTFYGDLLDDVTPKEKEKDNKIRCPTCDWSSRIIKKGPKTYYCSKCQVTFRKNVLN